jgi:hypothetical protein
MNTSATNQKSVKDAKDRLRKYLRTVETIPKEVLTAEARRVQQEAREEAPYQSGKLESSVRASVSNATHATTLNLSASARSSKGYNYAGIQHENTNFKHPIKGKANYLRDPYNRAVARIRRKIKQGLKFKGGK